MKFLPVVGRELRVASRRRGTYWLRSLIALLIIAVSAWIFLFNLDETPRVVAQTLFYFLTGGALLYCSLTGMRATADCISEEKREGTLGLLFLTDLKGYDVVLGKLVANSLNSFYGLLAILPVMGVPLLMGGVTVGELARVAAVLVNTMFLSVCVGIYASATSRSARKAIGLTFFLMLMFAAAVPLFGMWWEWYLTRFNRPPGFDTAWYYTSPIFSYISAQDQPFARGGSKGFYSSLVVMHALGWFFLLLACVVTPRTWQDRPAGALKVRWLERWKHWSYGNAAQRLAFRAALLDKNAFYWLAGRARLKPLGVWASLGAVACVWVWGISKFQKDWFNEGIYFATAFLLNSVLKNWFAAEAVAQLSQDRRGGSLELLLSTPITVKEILRGQALALRRQFLGPVLVTLLAELMMMLAGASDTFSAADRGAWIAIWIAGMVTLVTDLIALYWVGMWMGLAGKNPKRAYSATVGRVLTMPWVIYAIFLLFMALISYRGSPDVGWKTFLGFWVAVGLAADIGFGGWARQKLLTEFREAATRRYQRGVPLLRRLFGKAGAESELASVAE